MERIGRIGDLLHVDFGVMEAPANHPDPTWPLGRSRLDFKVTDLLCCVARISLFHDTTFAAWLQVWREEHGRMFVLSVDDAHDARVLMDYFPGTEEQEVVYNVRLRLCVCAVQRFHSLDVCRVLASPCFACLPRGPQTGPSLEGCSLGTEIETSHYFRSCRLWHGKSISPRL